MSEEKMDPMQIDLPHDPRTKVVSFRVRPSTAEDLDNMLRVLKVSRGEWLEGVVARDKEALGHIKRAVYDLNSLVEVIGMLKVYAIYAPDRVRQNEMIRALTRLEKDLREAIAMAPSYL